MAFAIAIILLVVGSVLFHFISPWWSTPIASNWGSIDDTILITFSITGVVFIVLGLFIAYAVIKYRYRPDRRSDYEPENTTLEHWLIGITSIGVIAMLAPGLIAWADYVKVPDNAAVVEAVGEQWTWTFRFPGKDGVLGTTDTRFINDDNPFGLNPDDPKGKDDILVDDTEVHLPIGVPVKFLLRSKDVLHDFYVPQFRAKMDLVPGLVTYLWFTPTRTGTFEILCAELCGVGHHVMRGTVVVEDQATFEAWRDGYQTFAQATAASE